MARSGKGEGDVGQGSPAPTARGRRNRTGTPITTGGQSDDRARLEALRTRLEQVVNDPETSARDLASVSREYRQTVAALASMAPAAAGTRLDEIAARRRKRGAS